jgi:hypothetical protein
MCIKTACIIQGNIREGFGYVLNEMQKHFSVVIVSTWEDERDKIIEGNFILIINEKPLNPGYSNRNYQRYSTARGLEVAKELNCEYVMKWRSDMLPTNLDINKFFIWANFDVPTGMNSRIVTCAFRNLSVIEDWFSSIPDLFAFGHIDNMLELWGDNNFNYELLMNPPLEMLIDEGNLWMKGEDISGIWCSESELYAIFKVRLQNKIGKKLNHELIAKNYMRLIDHDKLGIIWFGTKGKFRSILQAWQHPWWTEKIWKKGGVRKIHYKYPENKLYSYLMIKLFNLYFLYINLKQSILLKKYEKHIIQ